MKQNAWGREVPSNAPPRLKSDDLHLLGLILFEAQEMMWAEAHKHDAFTAEELDDLSEHILRLEKSYSVSARLRSDGFDALELTPRQASVLHTALQKVLPEIELFDEFQERLATSPEHAWQLLEIVESALGIPEADRMCRPAAAEIVRRRKLLKAELRRLIRLCRRIRCRGRLRRLLTWPVSPEPLFPFDAVNEIETPHVAEKVLAHVRSIDPLTPFKRDGGDHDTFWSRLEILPASGEQVRLDLVFLGEGYFGYKVGTGRMQVRPARSPDVMENLAVEVVRSARG